MLTAKQIADTFAVFVVARSERADETTYDTVDLEAGPVTMYPRGDRTSSFYSDGANPQPVVCEQYLITELHTGPPTITPMNSGIPIGHLVSAALNHSEHRIHSAAPLPELPYFVCSSRGFNVARWQVEFSLHSDSLIDTPDFKRTLKRLEWMYERLRSTYQPTLAEVYAESARAVRVAAGMCMPYGLSSAGTATPGVIQVTAVTGERRYGGVLHLLDAPQNPSPGDGLARVFMGSDLEPVTVGQVVTVSQHTL